MELVFAETSPYGSLEAVIEQDDQAAYFYLRGLDNHFGMKSCWIRNLVEAPEQLDRNRLAKGLPPALPRDFCTSSAAQSRLDEKDLRIVWFEEGEGAALFEQDQIIAIVPPVLNHSPDPAKEGEGFSRECQAPSPFCSPLPTLDHPLLKRIESADNYWKSWQSDSSPWIEYEPRILESYESFFGKTRKYFSIDGGSWPPRTLSQYHWKDKTVLLTVGLSLCRQPGVERVFDNPAMFRRIEWGACFDASLSPELVSAFGQYIGGQVTIPWRSLSFLAHGHTVSCDLLQQSPEVPDYSSIFLMSHQHCPISATGGQGWAGVPNIMGDPVNLLWSVPVFETERKFMQETANFSIVEQLVQQDIIPTIGVRRSMV